ERLGEELGLDVIGAALAAPYEETERHIRERRARGLFADMRFTMAHPERSCHPETLLPGARTVISAALCYYAPEPVRPGGPGALDDPGTLDATRCLSYWTQAAAPIPVEYRAELGAQVYGCDICQDVCPWNRGVEKRRAGEPAGEAHVSLLDWLRADDAELRLRYDRLFVPRNEGRWLRRNALVAAGNVGGEAEGEAVEAYRDSDDEL